MAITSAGDQRDWKGPLANTAAGISGSPRGPLSWLPRLGGQVPALSAPRDRDKSKTDDGKFEQYKELMAMGIDPVKYDLYVAQEINRKLKVRFAYVVVSLATLFTVTSYSIVILDSVLAWGIPAFAINALVIETPIQFIGLLYIIARNLFPGDQENVRGILIKDDEQRSLSE